MAGGYRLDKDFTLAMSGNVARLAGYFDLERRMLDLKVGAKLRLHPTFDLFDRGQIGLIDGEVSLQRNPPFLQPSQMDVMQIADSLQCFHLPDHAFPRLPHRPPARP